MTPDLLQILAWVATVLGVPTALFAAVNAVRALRTQAQASRLAAIIGTNTQWQEINKAADKVTFSPQTLTAVARIYRELSEGAIKSVLKDRCEQPITMAVPWVIAALLPAGRILTEKAPQREESYLEDLTARSVAFGYLRTSIADNVSCPWLSEQEHATAVSEFAKLDTAMGAWVGQMNEVAELYEYNLFDRLLFVRKRSVSIVQQMFAAEPYILWRNSTTPGRWGLRLLGLGAEARAYHWQSHLQRSALRLRLNPVGYGSSKGYLGMVETTGWIIGKGATGDTKRQFKRSERKLRRQLGVGFSYETKSLQNKMIAKLPISESSGLEDHSDYTVDSPKWSDFISPKKQSIPNELLARLRDSNDI